MKIVNRTRNQTLSSNARTADTFLKRFRGLMLSKPADMILVSPAETIRHSSIHMFFMKYPIDVIWVGSNKRVVDVRQRLQAASIFHPKTFGIIRPCAPAKFVVELGLGEAGETRVGDELDFV